MSPYVVRELPNVDDPAVIACCVCAQKMRQTLAAFLHHIILQLKERPLTSTVRVTLATTLRMTEGAISVELLCVKNRARDASILLLSLYELQLDLQYIALDPSRAVIWLDHTEKSRKPWKVDSQLKEIYTKPNELATERNIYRLFSMVKHCNPTGESMTFPLAFTRKTMQMDLAQNNHPFIHGYLYGLGVCIQRLADAASRIWIVEGLDVKDFTKRLDNQLKVLWKHNEHHIVSMVRQWQQTHSH